MMWNLAIDSNESQILNRKACANMEKDKTREAYRVFQAIHKENFSAKI